MKLKREKVAIYIDGGNTYRKLKDLGLPDEGRRFDFNAFANHLVGDRELVSKRYYVGQLRNTDKTEKSEMLVRKQQIFLETLRAANYDVKLGKIMYDAGRIREKGVDVKLAIEIVIGASDNLYDTALIPALKYAVNGKKKNIEYIGFAGYPSYGMIKESTIQRILSREDLIPFQYDKPVK